MTGKGDGSAIATGRIVKPDRRHPDRLDAVEPASIAVGEDDHADFALISATNLA